LSNLEIGIWSFPVLLLLIFLRVPIGLAMFSTGFAGMWMVMGNTRLPMAQLKDLAYSQFSNYSLSIVPMFLLMGYFATLGGMSQALFKAAERWLENRKGGVAMAAIGACAGFGAICGSSLATAATMSRVALPELKRYGYSGGFSTATLAAGGTLGILIPPSVVLVIYAILTEQNIAKLFLAAFVPGIIAALGYMMAVSIYVWLNEGQDDRTAGQFIWDQFRKVLGVVVLGVVFWLGNQGMVTGIALHGLGTILLAAAMVLTSGMGKETVQRFAGYWLLMEYLFFVLNPWMSLETATGKTMLLLYVGWPFVILWAFGSLTSERVKALIDVWPVLLVFIAVVGGIYGGIFTPTEGAAIGALGTGIIAFFAGGLTWRTLLDSFSDTARSSAMIFFIVLGAAFYNAFLARTRVPQELSAWVVDLGMAPLAVLAVILIIYLVLGCFMDSLSMILLTIPIFFPVITALDFGMGQEHVAIWFGILVLIVVEVGLITPPVGMNLFVINAMDPETPMVKTYSAVLYFVASDLMRVVLLVAFPAITLFLIP
jgi:TRAP-type C4-dicarboxylate transport system permease large subunit